jgi:hypothetical protein
MPALELSSQYEALGTAIPADSSQLTASPIDGYARHRIARSSQGFATLLLASREGRIQNYAAPVVLENLSVQYEMDCQIIRPAGAAERGVFTVITCATADAGLRHHFLRIAALVVEAVGPNPSRREIAETVESLIELFRALTAPARKSVQGLWAELFLIARSAFPEVLAAAWHVSPEDRFDFHRGGQRIEVKAASGRQRQHYFSLEQLRPLPEVSVVVASTLLERAGGGLSLATLLERVRSRLADPSMTLRIEALVACTLGESLRRSLDDAFDAELAEQSLRLYRQSDIPTIRGNLPVEVSEVRFKADLTQTTTTNLSQESGLFAALAGRT